MDRSSGILLPIFSLPGKYGIGTLGKEAYKFVDYIADMGVGYWQILPIHPLTYGNSPYQSTSTYAGNMFLIDLDILAEEGLLKKEEYDKVDFGSDNQKIDYEKVVKNKKPLLREAAKRFISTFNEKADADDLFTKNPFSLPKFLTRRSILKSDKIDVAAEKFTYNEFKNQFQYFLDDFVVFDLIKDRYSGRPYSTWDRIHRLHYDEVIKEIGIQNPFELEVYRVIQYFFFKQFLKLKKYANDNGIKIIGDMPIYSSLDSVEVFVDYKNFALDNDRRPYEVAGCPPDAFSADGQHWGNPLYNYDYMREDGYKYFIKRMAHLHELYDVIRIDHFRGFANYYAIPANEKTAKNGHWKMGPGKEIFDAIKKEVPELSIIAEDLGYIDEPVYKLLNETGFPGMKVVEFAFGGDVEHHQYLPKNYDKNCVAYLGTHDNDTFMGWIEKANEVEREQAIKFLHLGESRPQGDQYDSKGDQHNNNSNQKDTTRTMGLNKYSGYNRDAIVELYKSKSDLTIILMQDLLGLGSEARINIPSTVGPENWSYRFNDNYLDKDAKEFLKKVIKDTGR